MVSISFWFAARTIDVEDAALDLLAHYRVRTLQVSALAWSSSLVRSEAAFTALAASPMR